MATTLVPLGERLRPPFRNRRARRLTPAVILSVLTHTVLLALAILWARHPVEPPEWLPPPSFDVIFEGGNAAKPSVAAPQPHPRNATPPEPAPASPQVAPAPPSATTAPTSQAPASQAPASQAPASPPPPRVFTPLEPLPPSLALPPPLPPIPPRRPRIQPHPAFPAPMAFSLGGPAAPPAARRRSGRGIDLSFGEGVMGAEDTKVFGRTDSKEVGPDWFNRFSAWWDRHSYYPPEAGRNGDQGDVVLDLVIARSGQVERVALVSGSGSQWLDLAALGVFRGASLPPLPQDAAASVPLHLTIHYAIIRR